MDISTHERFAGSAAIAAYTISFLFGNVAWTMFSQDFLHLRHIHCPLFLLSASFVWFFPCGLVLIVATKRSWISSESYFAVHFGTREELFRYAIVPVMMGLRVAVQMYCVVYNTVFFITASLTLLPPVVFILDVFLFPRRAHLSLARTLSMLVVVSVGVSLMATTDSNAIGRKYVFLLGSLLVVEHGIEHYLQFQRPIGTSDTAMTLMRNWVAFAFAVPAFFLSDEVALVQSLPPSDFVRIALASLAVVFIAFGMTGLTGRVPLTVFFLIKNVTTFSNAMAAKFFLGENCTIYHYLGLFVVLVSLAIFTIPSDDESDDDPEIQPIVPLKQRCMRYPSLLFESNHFAHLHSYHSSVASSRCGGSDSAFEGQASS